MKNKTDFGEFEYQDADFDTELFGVKTANITSINVKGSKDEFIKNAKLLLKDLLEKLNSYKFIQCKLDISGNNIYLVQAMQEFGFFITSVDITLIRDLEKLNLDHDYEVAFCEEKDVEELGEMSKDAYSVARYYSDPNLPKEKVDELYSSWIKNCYHKKLADKIIIVKEKGKILGYNAVKIVDYDGKKAGRIILIAAKKEARGKGVGSVLIQEGFKWFKDKGCEISVVGTQAANFPALKAYQRNGYKLDKTILSFHKWN